MGLLKNGVDNQLLKLYTSISSFFIMELIHNCNLLCISRFIATININSKNLRR
jgi:hypothetical protein